MEIGSFVWQTALLWKIGAAPADITFYQQVGATQNLRRGMVYARTSAVLRPADFSTQRSKESKGRKGFIGGDLWASGRERWAIGF
jgi:hypothetical protein